jgi:peptidoglycan hydrolase CwlO-like protein
MRFFFAIVILSGVIQAALLAHAQAPMGQATPSIADLDQQLQEVGCRAERQTAAQTIVQLRAQIDALQKQLNAKDPPPKGGATKH